MIKLKGASTPVTSGTEFSTKLQILLINSQGTD
jgi:hypothetical protein